MENVEKIEAYYLKQVGDRVLDAKSGGALLTHATDSTTRKIVGTFAPAGTHIYQNEYLTLPTLPRNNTVNSMQLTLDLWMQHQECQLKKFIAN